MAMFDLSARPSSAGSHGLELLLKDLRNLRFKMDGNRNHMRAHLHIDYHRHNHMASYAVDDGTLLAGSGRYNHLIEPWIANNRESVMRVWRDIRTTGVDDQIVAQLRESAL
ncbi:DUF4160 domain-containing protein [Mesorhizobium sp. AA22]|uniref:DUF4160 domain-containing protein n=1 Tax=Mesorhizobium sp. AA22 TaxID=1854057 RepID=UPI0013977285|nr:DUF4160 domain-containing protein [Mesorhizobium sp. AA22]QIA22028.1 DUF4160 domain-containing protein [Mesorhizobium sp. AA22]